MPIEKNENIASSKHTRTRVCGLLVKDESLLLLKHTGLGPNGFIWSPPGGGVEFGETVEEALVREFMEETSIEVEIAEFLFVNEYIDKRFHAVELFFSVLYKSGHLKLGLDPEMRPGEQILNEAKFHSWEEIENIPAYNIHNAFRFCDNPIDIVNLKGFYKFHNFD